MHNRVRHLVPPGPGTAADGLQPRSPLDSVPKLMMIGLPGSRIVP